MKAAAPSPVLRSLYIGARYSQDGRRKLKTVSKA